MRPNNDSIIISMSETHVRVLNDSDRILELPQKGCDVVVIGFPKAIRQFGWHRCYMLPFTCAHAKAIVSEDERRSSSGDDESKEDEDEHAGDGDRKRKAHTHIR